VLEPAESPGVDTKIANATQMEKGIKIIFCLDMFSVQSRYFSTSNLVIV